LTLQDRDIVAIEDKQEIVCGLSNGTIGNSPATVVQCACSKLLARVWRRSAEVTGATHDL